MIDAARPPASLASLVVGLAQLGILGFGGVGPQAYAVFVEQRRWLSADDFAETLSLAQALPGANVVNLCAIVGDRWFGPGGAAAAVAAITVPPLAVALAAARLLARFAHEPHLVGAECGIVAASAGLIAANAWRVFGTIVRRRTRAAALAFVLAAAVATHFVAMPLATVVVLAAGIALDVVPGGRR